MGIALGLVGASCGLIEILLALLLRKSTGFKRSLAWVILMVAGCVIAVGAMELALLQNNFSLAYVAGNSTIETPTIYKIATLWGALEGSLLLWALLLCGYVAAAAWCFRAKINDRLVAWSLATMLAVCVFFFSLLIGPASPFDTLTSVPLDGEGLNPLLRNHPLMAIHPVMLYLGYVGFTVPFAFAVGALITGRLGEGWLVATRTWTLVAWGCLSIGILLGAWWSYEVLGWGGYWAWDPVENASFLPWLTGTAFLHSVIVQERRGMLRVWNLSLLLATFALTIFGTFLTRSGVIDSVHEFSASSIGPLFLGFFAIIVVASVFLIGWRGDRIRSPGSIDSPFSREGTFLANNFLFALFAFVVLLGTIFPLLVEAVSNEQIAVGRPYFDRMLMPIGLALLALMSVSPMLSWRSTSFTTLAGKLLGPAACGAGTMALSISLGAHGVWPVLGLGLGGSTLGSAAHQILIGTRRYGWKGIIGRTGGGMIAHIGIALIAFGFIASTAFSEEGEFVLQPGDSASVAGHEVVFVGVEDYFDGPNRVVSAQIKVEGRGTFAPAITRYPTFGRPISTPSVATSWVDDVYLSLAAIPDEGMDRITLRVLIKPLVVWMWMGGALIGLGTLSALIPNRREIAIENSVSSDRVEAKL